MRMRPGSVRWRGLLVLLATAGTTAAGWWLAAAPAAELVSRLSVGGGSAAFGAVPLEDALVGLCALALLGSVTWLLAVTVLLVIQTWTPSPTLDGLALRTCPPSLRRLVLAVCGATVAAGLTPPALAHPQGADQASAGGAGRATPVALGHPVAGLPLPDRPAPVPSRASVVVAPGDSLWSIARDLLPRRAGAAKVHAAVAALHLANRHRVGPDPDLIHPGTTLRVPPPLIDRKDVR